MQDFLKGFPTAILTRVLSYQSKGVGAQPPAAEKH